MQILRKCAMYIAFIAFIAVVFSCRRSDSTQSIENKPDEDAPLGFGTEEQIDEVFYRFPPPDEMMAYFEGEEMDYLPHLLLPNEKSKQYLDSKSQALSLGVYMADLAYLTLFNQTQETHKYMLSVYELSEKLRISSAFDFSVMKRLQDNINNMDSLKNISYEVVNDLNVYLEKNKKENTFILISMGGFIETLYLSFNMVGDFSEDNPLIQRIADQKFVLNNLVSFALKFSDDPNVADILETISPIRSKFGEIVVQKTPTKVEKDSTGKVSITGGNKYELTKEQYNQLRQLINNTRQKITQYQ